MTTDMHMLGSTRRELLIASWVTAAAFAASTAVQIASPPQTEPFSRTSDYLIEALFLTALLAATTAVVTLHRWHRAHSGPDGSRWGRFGLVAAALAAGGTALLALAAGATLVGGGTTLGAVFVVGLAAWVLGGVLLAVAIYRAGLLPRPVAVYFGLAIVFSDLIGEPAGPVTVAVLWAAVAITSSSATRRPSRARRS